MLDYGFIRRSLLIVDANSCGLPATLKTKIFPLRDFCVEVIARLDLEAFNGIDSGKITRLWVTLIRATEMSRTLFRTRLLIKEVTLRHAEY